jgi:uncharacterized membrane protein
MVILELISLIAAVFALTRSQLAVEQARKLQSEVQQLRNLLNAFRSGEEAAPKATGAWLHVPSAPTVTEPTASPAPAEAPAVPARTPVITVVPSAPTPSVPTKSARERFETLVGGRILNRVGALAVVLAVGFFLKYAFDNNLISEVMRVAIGAVVGGALLAGGERYARTDAKIFAQGLTGAGIAILYLTTYAACTFYHLIPVPAAFASMGVVTLGTMLLSRRNSSTAILVLGWIGGYATPLLLSSGEANEIGLFSYLAALNIGMLTMALRAGFAGSLIEFGSTFATLVYFILWRTKGYQPDDFGITAVFIIVLWGIFHEFFLRRITKGQADNLFFSVVAAAFNVLFLVIAVESIVVHHTAGERGLALFLVGAGYAATGYYLHATSRERTGVFGASIYIAAFACVIAAAHTFDPYPMIMLWGCTAVALAFVARWITFRAAFIASVLVIGTSVIALLTQVDVFGMTDAAAFTPLMHLRSAAMLALAAAAMASVLIVRGTTFVSNVASSVSGRLYNALDALWPLVLTMWIAVECVDTLAKIAGVSAGEPGAMYNRYVLTSGVVVATGWIIVEALKRGSAARGWSGIAAIVIGVIMVVANSLPFEPIEAFYPVLNLRAWMFFIAALALVLPAHRLPDGFTATKSIIRIAMIGAASVLLFVLISVEAFDSYGAAIKGALVADDYVLADSLRNTQQLTLSIAWIGYATLLMVLGFWRRVGWVRIGAIALFGLGIVKIFAWDLSFLTTLNRIYSFMVLGVILLAVSFAYTKFKGRL